MNLLALLKYAVLIQAAALVVGLSGCKTEEGPKAPAKVQKASWTPAKKVAAAPVKAELPPGVRRPFPVGFKSVWKRLDGTETFWKVVKLDGRIAKLHTATSCKVTFDVSSYSPPLSWRDCSGNTGSRKIVKHTGSLFPLAVGNTESWQSSGRDNKGNTWSGMRVCKVAGTANVTVPAGNFDTYHVICREDSWMRHDYWFSPELGFTVISARVPLPGKKGFREHRELIRLEPAG